mmetsp:Transcript_37541/g.82576  ORF Transcript_37541/g.82576 Transcript_37541/m.82576 type:complete len:202 (-) Transcript_37541:725-1330(-)
MVQTRELRWAEGDSSEEVLARPLVAGVDAISSSARSPKRSAISRIRRRDQRDLFACRHSRLFPIFMWRLSPKVRRSGERRRMKLPLELSRSWSQNAPFCWMIKACSPETEWSGMTTSLCSVKRPSEAVLCCAKLTQCRSLSVLWLDHDSRSTAGGRIIIACAFSGYLSLQMGQCVLTAEDPSGCIQRCKQLRWTYLTEPVH